MVFFALALIGFVIIPCLCVGQVVSAIICRKFKLDVKQCAAMIFVCQIGTLLFSVVQFFVGCDSAPVAGVNTAYSTSFSYTTDDPDVLSITSQ